MLQQWMQPAAAAVLGSNADAFFFISSVIAAARLPEIESLSEMNQHYSAG